MTAMPTTAKGQHQHKAKMSQRLEAVAWQLSDNSKVRLVLTNTSKSAVTATLKFDGITPGQKRPASISLPPGQTRTFDAEELAPNGKGKLKEMIGISIAHDGEPGAVLARGFASARSAGYSSSIEFLDPAMSVSSKLDGTGMRLSLPNGTALTPFVVARNTATTPSVIRGRLSYTTANGTLAALSLPETLLNPGELGSIDVLRAIRAKRVDRDRIVSAGLEFTYSTEPGTVLMSAHTVSRDGNQVFRIPLVDAKSEPASAAGYPWWIEESSSTVVHLKNVTDKPRQYTLHLNHEGGAYSLGLKTLQPGENVTLDIRDLRERQVPDAQGHTIPPQASRGQVNWSMRGAENHTLIGRSEQIDIAKGISSTYACMNCCPDSFSAGWVESDWPDGFVGESTQMNGFEQDSNCYGYYGPPYNPWPGWDNTVPSVCSTDNGMTTGEGEGQSTVQAIWTAYEWGDWESGGAGECNVRYQNIIAEALCQIAASPDHLVSLGDQQGYTNQLPNGGTCPIQYFMRQVQFQVVSSDSNGAAPVGNVVVRELFDSVTTNSCGNGQPQPEACRPTVNNGTFIDSITVYCAGASGPANCGYDINWSWHWCGRINAPIVKLASLNAEVRRDSVTLNGRSGAWENGTAFRR